MAIQIRVSLAANPSPTTLPRRIHFKQTLVSNRASEQITVLYTLDDNATGIRFEDANGQSSTTFERTDTVTRQPQEFEDRITMTGTPQGEFEDVEVLQTITTGSGSKLPDSTIVIVNR